MTKQEIEQTALLKAKTGQSFSNYPAIIAGFVQKGIPEEDIRPRENVFTYNAWKAQGKQVRRGEHGVKIITYITVNKKTKNGQGIEETKQVRRPRTVTVFHVSQVDDIAA